MIDALKDCFLVFLAAVFAFVTHYYLVNYRANQRSVTQPQQQALFATISDHNHRPTTISEILAQP